MSSKGLLLVVSGASGVGKGTVMKELFAMRDDLYMSVSATTRKPREGEVDGVHYHFISKEEFADIKRNDGFLENATFCDNSYGTLKSEVFERLEKGINVVLEIEVQGALQVRSEYPEGVFIYIAPPSFSELEARLVGRATEEAEVIEKRLETARWEMTQINKYNYVIINDEVKKAAERISACIDAEHVRIERCYNDIKEKLK